MGNEEKGRAEHLDEGLTAASHADKEDQHRKTVLEELRASEARYRTLVSQVKDYAIFGLDTEGTATSWNEGVQAVLGYSRDEFIGSPLAMPYLAEDVEAGIPGKELETARRQGSASDDRWLRRKDGTVFFAAGRTTRLTDAQGSCIGFSKVLRDETQRVLAEEQRRESEARFRSLVQNIRDYAIFLLDPNGLITEWTEGAQRVKGYAPHEVLGRHLAVFYTPEDVEAGEPARELRQAAELGRVEREGWRIRKGGERFWVNEIATAVRTEDGKLLGFTKISRDLTERRQAEQALLAADQRKDEFLATLAHELRNPLAPLRNGLHILREARSTKAAKTVEMMDRQLTHMVRLVDDLLDVARISSGKVELRQRVLDLRAVLAVSVEASRGAIEARRHTLRTDWDDRPITVNGDFDRLTQVFSNLLSNAAKYTEPQGLIEASVGIEEGQAIVKVVDTGIGIPPQDLPHVFDLFSQVRSHQGRAEGGLGIGLSLVRNLVALHSGSVVAYSEGVGRGSTFTVSLPLHAVADSSPSTSRGLPATASRPRRILIADDNIDAAVSLATILEFAGHEVTVAHDGLDAVMKAQGFRPEVVFLDLGMPKLNGLDAARRMRGLPEGAGMTLVALTGWGQATDRERTREAGFDQHLVKPVHPDELMEVLARSRVTPGR